MLVSVITCLVMVLNISKTWFHLRQVNTFIITRKEDYKEQRYCAKINYAASEKNQLFYDFSFVKSIRLFIFNNPPILFLAEYHQMLISFFFQHQTTVIICQSTGCSYVQYYFQIVSRFTGCNCSLIRRNFFTI